MQKTILLAALFVVAAPAFAGSYIQSGFDNSTIQAAGPRSGANNQKYADVEGSANGTFADFLAVDFAYSGVMDTINGLSVSLTESNASFTHAGTVQFYLTTNTTVDIDNDGGSPLTYHMGGSNNGVDPLLSSGGATLYDLGTGLFTTTGNVNSGQVDTYTLNPDSSGLAYLNSILGGGSSHNVRLIIVSDESASGGPNTAATWAGFANSTYAGPSMTLFTTPAPEPASMTVLGLGIAGLIARKRRK